MSSVKDSFQNALENFKKRLTQKELDDFSLTTPEDVRQAIADIQLEHGPPKAMMNLRRLQSFLEAMTQFGEIIEVFLNSSEFVAFVWGPLKFILQVAKNWSDTFDTILDAYEQIGDHIPLLKQYEALFESNPYMREILELIYSDILEFHKRALRFFSYQRWRQVFRSVWNDFKTRFQLILARLRHHRDCIERQATLLHIQQYKVDSALRLKEVDKSEESARQTKYKEVLEWMAGANVNLDHESAIATRTDYPDSGKWILRHQKVKDWKCSDPPEWPTLWLSGIPVAGKTILASVIIEDCRQDDDIQTSYFYCKHNDPERNTCSSVFKGLLSQILHHVRDLVPDLVHYCHEKYLASGELTLTSTALCKQLLELFCETLPKQYTIIDGLDECAIIERKQIVSFFNSLVSRYELKEPEKIRVLFVSQDETDIRSGLAGASWLSLRPADNADDIKSFVTKWCIHIQRKFELATWLIDWIVDSTCMRAEGMFLFAKLVMTNLFAQSSRLELQKELDPAQFPEGLEQAYERILVRISQNSSRSEWIIAQKLLGWMVCARRALKWQEIQAAVCTNLTNQTVKFEEEKLRFHIRDLCGSLIQVLPGDRVELVHGTAKNYIGRTRIVRIPIVECNLASLCLQYLTFEHFDADIEDRRLEDFARNGYFVFEDYAIASWSHHLRAVVKVAHYLLAPDSETREALASLSNAIKDFAECYEFDLLQDLIDDFPHEACDNFKDSDFYDSLRLVWNHICQSEAKGFDAKDSVSIKSINTALERNRRLLETLNSTIDFEDKMKLTSMYGNTIYKCPKLTCFYFHEGFIDDKSRKTHINRHERPFRCTFLGCSIAEFGFRSSKELERHERLYHPRLGDEVISFATPKADPALADFRCHLCPKAFTRGFSLRSHIRTHTSERPFPCSECGKTFTRANDCRRHEKLHLRRR